MQTDVEAVEERDLDVDEKAQFLSEARQVAVAVCNCLEKVVDADSGFGGFGLAGGEGVEVEGPGGGIVDYGLVAGEGDYVGLLAEDLWY